MANYMIELSFAIPLDTEEKVAWARSLCAFLTVDPDDRPSDSPFATAELFDDLDGYPANRYEVDDDVGLWIASEECGMPEEAINVCQAFLDAFPDAGPLSFEWADTCSKPRIGAFGGGAAIITATEVRSMHTSTWVAEQMKGLA